MPQVAVNSAVCSFRALVWSASFCDSHLYCVLTQVEWRCYVRQPRTTVELLSYVIQLTITGEFCGLLFEW